MYNNNIDELFKIIAIQLDQRAQVPASDIWPCERADITKTFDYSGPYLIDMLYKLFSFELDISEIASCFERPARMAYLCYLYSSQANSQNKNEHEIRMFVADSIIKCISYLRNGDPFLKSNKGNQIFRKDHNGKISTLENLNFITDIDNLLERKIRLVFAGIATLIEHTYFAWMGAGKEYHGIYDYNNKNYLIRDYYHLRVPHWEFSKNLPFDSLQFITEESENVNFVFDFNGRIKSKIGHMKKIALSIDGIQIKVDEFESKIDWILEVVTRKTTEALIESNKMTSEELLVQFARSQFFTVKTAVDKACLLLSKKNQLTPQFDHVLPQYIEQDIKLSANQPSSFEPTKELLKQSTNSNERIQLLYKFFHPEYDVTL